MKDESTISCIVIESDPTRRRIIELYLDSFARNSINMKFAGSDDQIALAAPDHWDVVLVSSDLELGERKTLIEALDSYLSHVPRIDLGESGGLVTSSSDSSMGEYLPKVAVSALSMLRSVGQLLRCRRLEQKIDDLEEKLRDSSSRDSVTSLWNRPITIERIAGEFMGWQRYKTPLTICLLHLSDLADIGELYGYETADEVSHKCARIVLDHARGTDFVGQFDHATFCLALPRTPSSSAMTGIERICRVIQQKLFTGRQASNFSVNVCCGVAQLSDVHRSPEDLVAAAQSALDRAKASGPGSIEIEESAPDGQSVPRVLIVEEQTSVLDFCCDVFQENGFAPTAASTARDARRAIHDHDYDLYVIDVDIDDGSGAEIVEKLAESLGSKPPIIAITGERKPTGVSLETLGVKMTLSKPFAQDDVLDYARRLIA